MKICTERFIVKLLHGLTMNEKLSGIFIFIKKNFRIIPVILFCSCLQYQVFALQDTKPNERGPWPEIQVNTYTGNLFYQRSDLFIPTRGEIALDINFAYNRLKNQMDYGFGNGWSFSFGIWYSKAGNKVTISRADGQEDDFTWTGAVYVPPVGVYDALTEYATDKYLLTTKHGIKYYFEDPDHKRLTKIVDRNGNTNSLTYTDGKPTTITDPSGRTLNLAWTNGHLSQITDPNTTPSRIISFLYDGSWNTIQVTRPLSNVFHYEYDSLNKMISVTDPLSTNVAISYNLDEAVAGMTCSTVGYAKTFLYDICNTTTIVSQVVSSVNRQTVYAFDPSGRVTGIQHQDGNSVSFAWDSQDNLISYSDENGHSTSYTYDANGNQLSETDCFGNTESFTYESTYNYVTSFTDKNGHAKTYSYDASGNKTGITDCIGNTESYAYNSHGELISATDKGGNTTTYSYNSYGDLTGIIDPLLNSVINTYDLVGNLLGKSDKRGFTTTYTYDPRNRHTGTVDALGYTSAYSYDANGNLMTNTKPDGFVTNYSYDPLNRLITKNSLLSGTTSYMYDEAGNMKSETNATGCTTSYTYNSRNRLTGTLDPLGYTESFSYSPVGKMLSSTDKGGNTTTYQYDCLDRPIKKTDPGGFFETFTYNAGSNMTSHTDKNGNVITFTHDCLNRRTVSNFPLGFSETTVYNASGWISDFYDKDGKVTLYGYNALGKQTSVTDPLGFSEFFSYDPDGNKTGSTDKNGHTTTYTYDNLGRFSSSTDPLGHTESHGYDPDGNMTSLTNKNGNTTSYAYDGLDRLTGKTDPLGYSESYSYDQLNNQTSYTDKNGNTSAMAYDCMNRQISKTDPNGFSDTYVYDHVGHVISLTDRNGHVASYTYSCCKLTGTTDPLGFTESYGYDPNGNRTTVTDKNGRNTVYAYDGLNRLSTITTPMGHQTLYTYNGVGSILTKTDANMNTTTHAYNDRNQLLNTSYPDATMESYSYDNAGNILQTTNTGGIGDMTNYTYDALNRLISKVTNYGSFAKTTTFTYDNNGNRATLTTESGTIAYVYDNNDRIVSINDQDSKVTTFVYDHIGNQLKISHPNGLFTYKSYNVLYNLKIIEVLPTDRNINGVSGSMNQSAGKDTIAPDFPMLTVDCGVMQIISPQSGPGLTNHEVVTILLMNYGTIPATGVTATYSVDGSPPVSQPVLQTLFPNTPVLFTFNQTADLSIPGHSYQIIACAIKAGDQNPANNCMTAIVVNQNIPALNKSSTYTYDHVGNKTSETNQDSIHITFQYDYKNQLLREENGSSGDLNIYTYTPTGKRASKTENGVPLSYSYNNDDILIAAGSASYVPDNNGNRTAMTNTGGTTQYSYGYHNELKHVILPDLSFVDYKYSPFRSLLAKNKNGVWTYFQSNGTEDLSLVDASGQPVEFYNPGLTIHHADTTGYYHYNDFGSSTLLTNSVMTVLATARFDAFGNIVQSTGTWLGNRIIFANWKYQDTVDLYTDGYGLFLDQTTGAGINGNPGEKVKDPVPKEPETKKPQGAGGGNPVEEKAKAKCCGVKKFEVTWSQPAVPAYPGNLIRLDVVIEFMDDETHSPACCEYCQFVSTAGNGTDANGKWKVPAEEGERHDDGYSRWALDENGQLYDYDGKPSLSDPGFETNDNPGIKGLTNDETIENYSFTADQAVIETCGPPCPTGTVVAKNGPHTVTVKGKSPFKYTFDGDDWKKGENKKSIK